MTTNTDNKTAYTTPREPLPNKAFDSEYMTEWVREVKFLADKGINYTFVRKTPVYNIKQYKYTKTPELFVALAEFYYQMANEKAYNRLNKVITESTTLPPELNAQLAEIAHSAKNVSVHKIVQPTPKVNIFA